MTIEPLAAIFGDHSLETVPPADIRQKSMPEKSKVARSLHLSVVSEGDLHAERAARGQGVQLVHRELALVQDRKHFTAHIACGTDDGDVVAHGLPVYVNAKFVDWRRACSRDRALCPERRQIHAQTDGTVRELARPDADGDGLSAAVHGQPVAAQTLI